MTQKDLADKMGVSISAVKQILSGKPSYTTLEKIASALDVEMWELFVSKNDITPPDLPSAVCPHCGKPIKVKLE